MKEATPRLGGPGFDSPAGLAMPEQHPYYTNDQTKVEFPEKHKEAFDIVLQEGPERMEDFTHPTVSLDEFAESVGWLLNNGWVEERRGDLDVDGTNGMIYYVPKRLEEVEDDPDDARYRNPPEYHGIEEPPREEDGEEQ